MVFILIGMGIVSAVCLVAARIASDKKMIVIGLVALAGWWAVCVAYFLFVAAVLSLE
jgi:hypothetical protein